VTKDVLKPIVTMIALFWLVAQRRDRIAQSLLH